MNMNDLSSHWIVISYGLEVYMALLLLFHAVVGCKVCLHLLNFPLCLVRL
jgi:hypothetical protein